LFGGIHLRWRWRTDQMEGRKHCDVEGLNPKRKPRLRGGNGKPDAQKDPVPLERKCNSRSVCASCRSAAERLGSGGGENKAMNTPPTTFEPSPACAGSALVRAVGSRLRAARKASGVTNAALHLKHGYSHSTINRWELRSLPTIPHLLKLCRIYNIPPSQILNEL
jgi:Helix-turn-helix